MTFKTVLSGAAAGLALAATATTANAVITTFATFSAITADNIYVQNASPTNQSSDLSVYSIPSPTLTTPGPVVVKFSFINEGPNLDTAVSGVNAVLTFSGTEVGNPTVSVAGYLIQRGVNGSFSLKSTTGLTIGSTFYAAGSNLLSGAFTGAEIAGPDGSSSGGLEANNEDAGLTLTYTSDFITFPPSQTDAALSLTSINPTLSAVSLLYALRTFDADAGGSFSADPNLVSNSVPEPAAWALMLTGFGVAGASLRLKSRHRAASAA